jgi:hypothetical protein
MNPHLITVLRYLSLVPSVFFAVYIVKRYADALRRRPAITKVDILYEENFASGASQKNWMTKIGGARNCLRLVVTKDLLWVTSWFPFGIFAAACDLDHVIPLDRVTSVQSDRFLRADTLLLTFIDLTGGSHTLRLMPKNRERFLEAIRR